MMMQDYKRALYDFSAAFFNQDRHENKQPNAIVKPEPSCSGLFYMSAGQCNYHLGMYTEALAHYAVATKRDRENYLEGQIAYNRGLANASLTNYLDAISDYKQSIKVTEPAKQASA